MSVLGVQCGQGADQDLSKLINQVIAGRCVASTVLVDSLYASVGLSCFGGKRLVGALPTLAIESRGSMWNPVNAARAARRTCPTLGLFACALLLACARGTQGQPDSGQPDGGDAGRLDGGHDGGHDFTSCTKNADCAIVPESCCGACGAPARGDAVAVRADQRSAYRVQACATGASCPACAPLYLDPTLVATCSAGRCALVDLQVHAASACEQDADCHVRTPDCCECGGDTSVGRLVGISDDAAYRALVCDDQACPECAPIYPVEVTVGCGDDGHCRSDDARLP